MTTLGVIGNGFIGKAFIETMKKFYDILIWDTDPKLRNVNSLKELVIECDYIFVSVPTPMFANGQCDTSIVESVLQDINSESRKLPTKTIIIRSTVPPGSTEYWNVTYYNKCHLVFNPEFLTEANYIKDFANQDRIILGGNPVYTSRIANIYRKAFPAVPMIQTSYRNAEMVKYLTNTFLAVKVSFANEMKQICDSVGAEYDVVSKISMLDTRLGTSHWKVPGPDGHKGFGGTCFPKDINALIAHAKRIGVNVPILEAVWSKNLTVRPERDWETLKGRAVTS